MPARAAALAALEPRVVVAIRLQRLGDVLLATPTLRALRQRYPAARLVAVTGRGGRALLEHNPDLDTLIVDDGAVQTAREVRALGADLVVDLQRSTRSSALCRASGAPVRLGRPADKWHDRALTHQVPAQRAYSAWFQASILRVLGVSEVDLDLVLALPAAAREAAASARGRVGLAPGAMAITRKWPTDRWIALARSLTAVGPPPIVLWGPAEVGEAAHIAAASGAELAPPTSIVEMGAWIGACEALVTSCSAARHLAVAVGTPSVALHGASSIGGWTRPSRWHRALWTELPCRPCHSTRCDIGVKCLADIAPERALAMLDEIRDLGPEPSLRVRIRA